MLYRLRISTFSATFLVVACAGLASADAELPLEGLAGLTNAAIARNPELRSIEAQIVAIEHKVTRAGAWNDPKLTVAYQNVPIDSFALGEERMSMVQLRLDQKVPFFGKTEERRGVVREEAEAKRWELEEAKSRLRVLVKQAYYRLALSRHLKKITVEHVDLVAQLIDTVRIKYEVGKARQHDLLRLEVLKGRLEDDLEDFDRDERELTAILNSAMHRDYAIRIVTPTQLTVPSGEHSVPELLSIALEHRPELKRLAAMEAEFRAASKLALFEAVPDPTVFVGYGARQDISGDNPAEDLVTIGFAIPLPLFHESRYESESLRAASSARSVREQSAALQDRITQELAESTARLQRATRKAVTYKENLVIAAHRTLDATLASYRVDRSDFATLYDAEVELLDFEKTIRIATADALIAQAALERIVGKEL